MKARDLTKVLKTYTSGWLLLDSNDNVVAHTNTFKGIAGKLKASKNKNVHIMSAYPKRLGFVGLHP